MNIEEIKKQINEAGFSSEAKEAIFKIMNEGVTEENKSKILEIIQLEIDRDLLQAEVEEKIANSLESYITNMEAALEETANNLPNTD